MRSLLTLAFLFIAHAAFSQTLCDLLVKIELDSATGAYSKISEDIVIVKNSKPVITIGFAVMDRTIIFSVIVAGGVYCVDETSKATFSFRDGSTLEMLNNSKFNCDGDFSLFFYGAFGKKKEFNELLTKEIQHIKIGLRKSVVEKTRANFIEADIEPAVSKTILQTAGCLVE